MNLRFLVFLLLACGGDAPVQPVTPPSEDPAADYTCPMHPSVHQDHPGRCPLCGMDLVKVTGGATGAVSVGEDARRHFGIRTVTAERKSLQRTLRFAGTVGWDLRRQRDVAVRVTGVVAGLRVTLGSAVRAGDALFSLESPDLAAAQADFIAGGHPSARARLLALGLTEGQVRELEARGAAMARVPVLAPVAGVVTVLDVVEGSPASPGVALARIADAGAVWIEANLSGADAALISEGMTATATVEGVAFTGTVHALASEEAVARVRVDVAGSAGKLRPGAVAVVDATVPLAPGVVVPVDAVVYAGTRRIVFVEDDQGQFAPREVVVGARVGGEIVVGEGLMEGEVVVAAGAFLVAAESRIHSPGAWGAP